MEHYRKLERMYAKAPINAFYGPVLTVSEGRAEVEIEVQSKHHHSAGAMHGSVYFKMLDDAAWFAANSVVPDVFVLTTTFEVNLLRPVAKGRIRAVGVVTAQDERRIHATAELFDDQGTVIGRGQGRFALSRIPLTPEVHYQ